MKIDINNYEIYFLDYLEGKLTAEETAAMAEFLKDHPSFIKDFESLEGTLLKPDTEIVYPHKSRLKRNIIAYAGVKKVFAIMAVAASVLLFSTLLLKYINQPTPGTADKQIAQIANKSIEAKKTYTTKGNTADTPPVIKRPNKSVQHSRTFDRKANTSERSIFVVPAALTTLQSPLLAISQISIPRTIERRTDFDGIPSTAYYDPEPDILPINSDGITIGGRFGFTLAQGISQTAGTIARDPEVGRLLSGKFSLSAIADLGLAGYNLITDSKLSISRDYDSDGFLKGHSLNDGDKRLTRLP